MYRVDLQIHLIHQWHSVQSDKGTECILSEHSGIILTLGTILLVGQEPCPNTHAYAQNSRQHQTPRVEQKISKSSRPCPETPHRRQYSNPSPVQLMWTVCAIKCAQLMCCILDFNVWTMTGSLFMWIKCGIKSVFVNSIWNQICFVNSVSNQICFVNSESMLIYCFVSSGQWKCISKYALFFNLYKICAKCFCTECDHQTLSTLVSWVFSSTECHRWTLWKLPRGGVNR
jgi:hypothetical protein